MKIKALSVFGILASVFFGWLVICAVCDPREPIYEGYTLSKWLIIYEDSFGPYMGKTPPSHAQIEAQSEASEKAIRAIGTNAIPTALRWLSKNYDVRDYFYISAFSKGYPLDGMAETTLEILGEQARPAVPALIQLADGHKDSKTRIMALGLLEKIETNSAILIPVFIKCARTDKDAEVRDYALNVVVQGIGLDRKTGEDLVSALLNDPDEHVRHNAKLFHDEADFFFIDSSDGTVKTNDIGKK